MNKNDFFCIFCCFRKNPGWIFAKKRTNFNPRGQRGKKGFSATWLGIFLKKWVTLINSPINGSLIGQYEIDQLSN